MHPPSEPTDPHEADLQGLPQRSDSRGRDRLEEIATQYLQQLRETGVADIEQFVARDPRLAAEIREFLPLVAAMEGWKSHQDSKVVRAGWAEEFSVKQLGDCRIVREVARGGMGIVFEAEQESIGRKVAVKLLPRRFAKHSTRAAQFVREARIAARLQHPNIVPIFSFGEQDDNFYYVMQFIEGAGLDRLIASWKEQKGLVCVEELIAQIHPREKPVLSLRTTRRFLRSDSWPQLGKIGAQIAAALRHAHQQGTLHRDVKPGNLLIDQQGKVWITDFGLAVGREHDLDERPETVAGTVRYMAPEQFSGHGDERSDIYSLGATLYELCTLQPAFTELNQRKMMLLIRDGKFAPPRQARREIPVELERIILKAMSCEPARRYRSAGELQGELLAFVNSGGVRRGLRWRRLFGS